MSRDAQYGIIAIVMFSSLGVAVVALYFAVWQSIDQLAERIMALGLISLSLPLSLSLSLSYLRISEF